MVPVKKIVSFFMTVLMFLFPTLNLSHIEPEPDGWKTNYTYVFVHGYSGWGSYDALNAVLPYWGLTGGDLVKNLNKQGYSCRSASVDPEGSAWDRACELYAQLAGTRVDYGKAHSEQYGHDRFGKDFSKKPLVDAWSAEDKLNLVGHSFGGTTTRLLAELMASGSKAERRATDPGDLSPLFAGGKGDWIYSITTVATPNSGTTTVGLGNPELEAQNPDSALYDVTVDNAMALNRTMRTRKGTFYFAIPCSCTVRAEDGTHVPDKAITERQEIASATQIGKLTGVTPKGCVIDKKWLENDGTVNTISAGAPLNARSVKLDRANIRSGVWNVAPTVRGDHMCMIGDITKTRDIRTFYADWIEMINAVKPGK